MESILGNMEREDGEEVGEWQEQETFLQGYSGLQVAMNMWGACVLFKYGIRGVGERADHNGEVEDVDDCSDWQSGEAGMDGDPRVGRGYLRWEKIGARGRSHL